MNSESWKVKLALLLVSSLTIMSMITISASLPDMTDAFSNVPNGKKLVKLVLKILKPMCYKKLNRFMYLKTILEYIS